MAVPNILVSLSGSSFPIPQVGTAPWGQNVTNWIVAASGSTGFVQLGGGSQPLAADLNFGPSFGLISIYFKSRSANIAAAGVLRLANADTVNWRNFGNTADDLLFPGITANSQSVDDLYYKNATSGLTTQLTGNPFAEYNTLAGQSIPNAANTVINYGTLVTDTDSAVTVGAAWKFTVPTNKPGLYMVSANATLGANQAGAAPGRVILGVYKNGTEVHRYIDMDPSVGIMLANYSVSGSTIINCAAGDTINVQIFQGSGAGAGAVALAVALVSQNRIVIKRIS